MGCFIYCLYSTEDGDLRYVGKTCEKVSYRYKQHVTSALDYEKSPLYDWIRDVWRSGGDIGFYILQEGIIPADLDLFEKYWISQFVGLLNAKPASSAEKDSIVANEIKSSLREQAKMSKKQSLKP